MQRTRVVLFTYFLLAAVGCTWSGSKPEETGSSGGATGTGGTPDGTGGMTGSGGSDPNGSGGAAVTDGGPNDMMVDTVACGMQMFALESTPPDLLLVLDHSGSMIRLPDGNVCDTATCIPMRKWEQVTVAIKDVVTQTDTTIRWGLKFFPDDLSCGTAAAPAVPIGDKKGAAIVAAIDAFPITTNGSTPTRTAMNAATAYLMALPETNPKYIVLATDGLPNCMPGAAQAASDAPMAVAAVMDAASKGVPVFVIGIGTLPEADTTLNQMAMAGMRPRAMAPLYYPVTSSADLVSTLKTIQRKIASCEFNLEKKPPDPKRVKVTGDGMDIPKDATNGWDFTNDMMTIKISGSYCDKITDGVIKDIQAIFGCMDIP